MKEVMRQNSRIGIWIFLLLGPLLWASCRVTKPYERPVATTDSLFRGMTVADTHSIATLPWQQLFTDPILQQHIRTAITRNPDLQIAYTRIQAAEAYYRQSRAAFLPTLDANVNVSTARISEAQGFGIRTRATQYQLGLSSGWELDLWGKLRSGRDASLAVLLQSEAGARAVQTGLVASVANYYFTLLALDQQVLITRQTIRYWDTTVRSMQALKDAAIVTQAAVVQSEAQRYGAEVTLPDLLQRIRETEHAMSILLGTEPEGIERGSLAAQQPVAVLRTGVPAQLLANRPDVQAAEYNFRYAFELTNVARTYFYPSLVLTASAGISSLALSTLFDPASIAASIGAGIAQPIFNRRANKTRLEVARAQQQEAWLNFQNTLLQAGQEVSDAISLYQTAFEKASIRDRQMTALERSVSYSQELLANGFANYTEVIQARQLLLQAELGRVNDRLQQLTATVNLYRALGGGWR
jgi:multidrug efflux system outer membrane protein